ncbi:MAG TPA: endonuclease/exonuclease/phosphatase family protein [Pirellulales bacterium]|jgi:endonuclease/exonuclease/phosphatase family metal-dependent hydrolase|nr:endonuclease/exonuclease/phosphatase family protein [Pirellulales bacterium]
MDYRLRSLAIVVMANLFPVVLPAAEVRIATWNVHEGFTTEAIYQRREEFERFGKAVRPDILLLQEVTSLDVLRAVRECVGLDGYEAVCSDFTPSDEPDFSAFEVGIVSRWPLSEVIEYDPSPDYVAGKDAPPELLLEPQWKLGIRKPADDVRGFLWARIDALKTTFAVVHLKSSRGANGPDDYSNAQKREFVAATIAVGVLDDRQFWPSYNCIVGGDFNVGHSDRKNGHDLFGDTADGYDDTHALFAAGIVGGLKMRNLGIKSTEPTFPSFPSSPIDNIYAVGPQATAFKPAVIENSTFGSDHRPVWTAVQLTVNDDVRLPGLAAGHEAIVKPASSPAPGPGQTILASEATKHIDQHCKVELVVRGGTVINGGTMGFLNSLADFRNKENFTVVLRKEALKELAEKGLADPPRDLRDKTIRVDGTIVLRNGLPQIEARQASQIEVVEGT